jgi:hypothetical protein
MSFEEYQAELRRLDALVAEQAAEIALLSVELGEISILAGPGGDDSPKGRVESVIAALTAQAREADAALDRAVDTIGGFFCEAYSEHVRSISAKEFLTEREGKCEHCIEQERNTLKSFVEEQAAEIDRLADEVRRHSVMLFKTVRRLRRICFAIALWRDDPTISTDEVLEAVRVWVGQQDIDWLNPPPEAVGVLGGD